MRKFITNHLQNKILIAFFVVLLIPSVITVVYNVISQRTAATEKARTAALDTIAAEKLTIEGKFDHIPTEMDYLSGVSFIKRWADSAATEDIQAQTSSVENATTETQTFTGPTGPVTLAPTLEQGYNIPVNESTPYVFELTTTSPKKTLTVATKTPK